jgi:GST-like protein
MLMPSPHRVRDHAHLLMDATEEHAMIDLYYWGTPNGLKLKLFMEESGLPHRIIPVDIGKGEQFEPEFLKVSPNNKIPALVDLDPADGGAPISLFESGAMLLYLAEKTGRFIPAGVRGRAEVLQWLFWQVGGLGPMAGQNGHFTVYAPEKVPYAIERYVKETNRLYGVLDKHLADREFIAGEYSIADMACYPWIVPHEPHGQNLDDFPNLKRWFETIKARPATIRAYEGVAPSYAGRNNISEEERRILFGQTAASVK